MEGSNVSHSELQQIVLRHLRASQQGRWDQHHGMAKQADLHQ